MSDGSLGGEVDVLIENFEMVWHIGSTIGSLLKERKCELVTDDMEVDKKIQTIAPSIHSRPNIEPRSAWCTDWQLGRNRRRLDEDLRLLTCRLKLLCTHDAYWRTASVWPSHNTACVAHVVTTASFFTLTTSWFATRCSPFSTSLRWSRYGSKQNSQSRTAELKWGFQHKSHSHLSCRRSPVRLNLCYNCCRLDRLHSSSVGNDLLFTAAVDLWRQQIGRNQPPNSSSLEQHGTPHLLTSP